MESLERTCGACVKAREGEDEVDSPGTFDIRRLGGVAEEVCMSEDELISSANCVFGSLMLLYLAKFTVLSREAGRERRLGRSLALSICEMNEAMSSLSSDAGYSCAEGLLPSGNARLLDLSLFEPLLARPELPALSPVLLPCAVYRFVRPAKLLLYRCTGAGFGDDEPELTTAVSLGIGGARSACCGKVFKETLLLLLEVPASLIKLDSDLPAEVPGDGDGRGEDASDPDLKGGLLFKFKDGSREIPIPLPLPFRLSTLSLSSSSTRCLSSETGDPRFSAAWKVPKLP